MNTATEFLARLEADPNEKKILKIREDITIKPIEGNIESTGMSHEETDSNTDDDLTEVPEYDIWQRKVDIRNTTSSQPTAITIASYYHIDLLKGPSTKDMAHFNKLSRSPIEQDSDTKPAQP